MMVLALVFLLRGPQECVKPLLLIPPTLLHLVSDRLESSEAVSHNENVLP